MWRNWMLGLSMMAMPAYASEPQSASSSDTTLHIMASGMIKSRADRLLIRIPIEEKAQNAKDARAAAQAKIDRLQAALSSIGIASTSVIIRLVNNFGFLGNEANGDEPAIAALHLASPSIERTASSLVEITLADPGQVKKVNMVLDDLNLAMLGNPRPSLIDERAARNAAIADAIGKARAEAESYAAGLGLSVGRINHVSNDCGGGSADYKMMMAGWSAMFNGNDLMVETTASACVDFVLEKR